jgi:hypothetical protein
MPCTARLINAPISYRVFWSAVIGATAAGLAAGATAGAGAGVGAEVWALTVPASAQLNRDSSERIAT